MRPKKILISIVILFWFSAGPLLACTIVMAFKDGKILVGNNEDRAFYGTTVRVLPATEKFFGRIFFGYTDAPVQGGMNDKGLVIDGNALRPTGWKPEEGKPYFRGNVISYILANCATVKDVQAFFEKYNIGVLERARFPVADRTGDSMVVEYGQGKVQFVKREGYYQIATNFVFTNVENSDYPCTRYRTADRILGAAKDLDVSLIRDVLDATHQEGGSETVYSNIYDLKNGLIYIYNVHDFSKAVTLDFSEEIERGARTFNLPSLFEEKRG
jgi:predicted choloylglycine hydrolase